MTLHTSLCHTFWIHRPAPNPIQPDPLAETYRLGRRFGDIESFTDLGNRSIRVSHERRNHRDLPIRQGPLPSSALSTSAPWFQNTSVIVRDEMLIMQRVVRRQTGVLGGSVYRGHTAVSEMNGDETTLDSDLGSGCAAAESVLPLFPGPLLRRHAMVTLGG